VFIVKRLLPVFILSLVFLFPAIAQENKPVIVVLGDSISAAWGINTDEGWVNLLRLRLAEKNSNHDVINASVSGDTSRTGLNRLDDILARHEPTVLIVELGGNDGLRGITISETRNSLAAIIEKGQQSGARVLLAGVRLPPNYGPYFINQFTAMYRELAEKYQVPLVPRILDQVADFPELMQDDGMHPNREGQKQILENVWPKLERLLE
jgi:acyl-CoA thioesterase-1